MSRFNFSSLDSSFGSSLRHSSNLNSFFKQGLRSGYPSRPYDNLGSSFDIENFFVSQADFESLRPNFKALLLSSSTSSDHKDFIYKKAIVDIVSPVILQMQQQAPESENSLGFVGDNFGYASAFMPVQQHPGQIEKASKKQIAKQLQVENLIAQLSIQKLDAEKLDAEKLGAEKRLQELREKLGVDEALNLLDAVGAIPALKNGTLKCETLYLIYLEKQVDEAQLKLKDCKVPIDSLLKMEMTFAVRDLNKAKTSRDEWVKNYHQPQDPSSRVLTQPEVDGLMGRWLSVFCMADKIKPKVYLERSIKIHNDLLKDSNALLAKATDCHVDNVEYSKEVEKLGQDKQYYEVLLELIEKGAEDIAILKLIKSLYHGVYEGSFADRLKKLNEYKAELAKNSSVKK